VFFVFTLVLVLILILATRTSICYISIGVFVCIVVDARAWRAYAVPVVAMLISARFVYFSLDVLL
jgi:hypothetical protein